MRKKNNNITIPEKPIGAETEEAIADAALYLDTERAIASIEDGMKPSYRRLIWSAMQFPKGELQPSVKVINGMSSYHPHSLQGCEPLLASMVRSGIMTGTGSFGTTSILGEVKPAASPRYTKTRLSDLYYGMLKPLMQCTKLVESPVGPLEPEKLFVVFPLCLYFRSLVQGLGYGVSTIYPNFSPESLYKAMIHDDPKYLEANVDLILDKRNSELDKLWTTGKGRVIYSYKLSKYTSEDGKQGYLFEGDTCIFTPGLRKIKKYVDTGQVFIEDMTDKKGPKMFVGLVNNRGSLDIKGLEKLCRTCCYDATVYQLNVTDGKSVFRIPLRDWLHYTYDNYIKVLKDVNLVEIDKVKFQIQVQQAIPEIANYLINVNIKASNKEIREKFGLSEEIVEAVMEKPISYLRANTENKTRITGLNKKLRELMKFDPVKYTEDLISKL